MEEDQSRSRHGVRSERLRATTSQGRYEPRQPAPSCYGLTALFYGPEVDLREEAEPDRKEREARCKKICQGCPIQWACLEWAIEHREPFGVWGGMAHRERERMLKWLRKQDRDDSPQAEELPLLIRAFRKSEQDQKDKKRAERKRKRKAKEAKPKPQVGVRIIPAGGNRNGTRSQPDGNGARGVGRAASAQVGRAGNGAHPSKGQGPRLKAASPQGRKQGVSRNPRGAD